MSIGTIGDTQELPTARAAKVYVRNADGEDLGHISVIIIPNFAQIKATDWNPLKKHFPHLRNLVTPRPAGDGSCKILLGNNCGRLFAPRQQATLQGELNNSPVAVKTTLGWSVAGPTIPGVETDPWDKHVVKTLIADDKVQAHMVVARLKCSQRQA